jgi:hypothetical protein
VSGGNVAIEAGSVARATPAVSAPRWGALEAFIVVQYLSTALFFIPGTQGIRIALRMLPFLLSGALLFYRDRVRPGKRPAGATLLGLAILLLGLNLLHPSTDPMAGIAQLALQVCIAAPLFWVDRFVRGPSHLGSLLILIFAVNALSATVGLLQVFFPGVFMPSQFNQIMLANDPNALASLSYVGPNGQRILRPPGLTDGPGGAALPGVLAMILGIALAVRPSVRPGPRTVCLFFAAVGIAVLYFTQVRSLFMMAIIAVGAFAVLSFVRGNRPAAVISVGVGALIVIVSFVFAASVGGEAVTQRFLGIMDQGVVESYSQHRGGFIRTTMTELLDEYPMGAGVGRWGVMKMYFGDAVDAASRSIYVEIQMTGWLLDGGVLMWLLYGGAIVASLAFGLRVALRSDTELALMAAVIVCCQLMIAGMSFAGPAFNTQFGIQFWTLGAALHGAVLMSVRAAQPTGRAVLPEAWRP